MDLSFFIIPQNTIFTIYDIPEFTDEVAKLITVKLISDYRPEETLSIIPIQTQILFEVIRHNEKDIIVPMEIRVNEEIKGMIDMFNLYDISGFDVTQLPIYKIISFHLRDEEKIRNHITIMPNIMPEEDTLVYWDLSEDSTLYEKFMKSAIERYFMDEATFLRYCSLRGVKISRSTLKNYINNKLFPNPYYSKDKKKNLYNPSWISYIETVNTRKTSLIMQGKKIKSLSSLYDKDIKTIQENVIGFNDIMGGILRDRFKGVIDDN